MQSSATARQLQVDFVWLHSPDWKRAEIIARLLHSGKLTSNISVSVENHSEVKPNPAMLSHALFVVESNIGEEFPSFPVCLVGEARMIRVEFRAVREDSVGEVVQVLDLYREPRQGICKDEASCNVQCFRLRGMTRAWRWHDAAMKRAWPGKNIETHSTTKCGNFEPDTSKEEVVFRIRSGSVIGIPKTPMNGLEFCNASAKCQKSR